MAALVCATAVILFAHPISPAFAGVNGNTGGIEATNVSNQIVQWVMAFFTAACACVALREFLKQNFIGLGIFIASGAICAWLITDPSALVGLGSSLGNLTFG